MKIGDVDTDQDNWWYYYYIFSLSSGFERDTQGVSDAPKRLKETFGDWIFEVLKSIAEHVWDSIKGIEVIQFSGKLQANELKYLKREKNRDALKDLMRELFEDTRKLAKQASDGSLRMYDIDEERIGFAIIDNFAKSIVIKDQVKELRKFWKEKHGIEGEGMDYLSYFMLLVALDVVVEERNPGDLEKVVKGIFMLYGKYYDNRKVRNTFGYIKKLVE